MPKINAWNGWGTDNRTNRPVARPQCAPSDVDVVVVGAGPYGLSIAAHLTAWNVDHAVFGEPMGYWRLCMPRGMTLKSEGMASSLYDPNRLFSLQQYCSEAGIRYAPWGVPVSLQDFVSYGLAFQKACVPNVYAAPVATISKTSTQFRVELVDGSSLSARAVVVAVGLTYFSYIPDELRRLPAELLTHSSEHHSLEFFKGRQVAVIGAGASAVDTATLLYEAGADAVLVARAQQIQVPDSIKFPRPLWDRIRWPLTAIGPSWRSLFYAEAPGLFHLLPETVRLPRAKRYLGPAAGHMMRDRFSVVPQLKGHHLVRADVTGGKVRLTLAHPRGAEYVLDADHVIAATGFRVDLRRVLFLKSIRDEIKAVDHTPVLSSNFESSVPGLYFVGPTAVNSFGPVMRFVYGAKFTSTRVARSLALRVSSKSSTRARQFMRATTAS